MFQKRKKTSAQDVRAVPTAVGYVAIAFVVFVLGLMAVIDIPSLGRDIRELKSNISNYFNA